MNFDNLPSIYHKVISYLNFDHIKSILHISPTITPFTKILLFQISKKKEYNWFVLIDYMIHWIQQDNPLYQEHLQYYSDIDLLDIIIQNVDNYCLVMNDNFLLWIQNKLEKMAYLKKPLNQVKRNEIFMIKNYQKYKLFYENIHYCIKYRNICMLNYIWKNKWIEDIEQKKIMFEVMLKMVEEEEIRLNDQRINMLTTFQTKYDILFFIQFNDYLEKLGISKDYEFIQFIFQKIFLNQQIIYYKNVESFIDFMIENKIHHGFSFHIDFKMLCGISDSIPFPYIMRLKNEEFIKIDFDEIESHLFKEEVLPDENFNITSQFDVGYRTSKQFHYYINQYKKIHWLHSYIESYFGKIVLPYKTTKEFFQTNGKGISVYKQFVERLFLHLPLFDLFLRRYKNDLKEIPFDKDYHHKFFFMYEHDKQNHERIFDFMKMNFEMGRKEFDSLFSVDNLFELILVINIISIVQLQRIPYVNGMNPKIRHIVKRKGETDLLYQYLNPLLALYEKHGCFKFHRKNKYFFYQMYSFFSCKDHIQKNDLLFLKYVDKKDHFVSEFASFMDDLNLLTDCKTMNIDWDEFVIYNACKFGYDKIFKYAIENHSPFNLDNSLKILKENLFGKPLYPNVSEKNNFMILHYLLTNNYINNEQYTDTYGL